MVEHAFIVPPRSRKEIREIASRVREVFGAVEAEVDIIKLVELELPTKDDGFVLHIVEPEEMGDIHGLTNPIEKWMHLRADVYDGACAGKGRDRMTVAHELGHYLLHRRIDFPSITPGSQVPAFRQSEWQANTFAAELLIGITHIQGCSTVPDVVEKFSVSYEAARVQLEVLKQEGLIK